MSNVKMNYRGVAVGATCLLIILLVFVSVYHRSSPELQHISRSTEHLLLMPKAARFVSIFSYLFIYHVYVYVGKHIWKYLCIIG